MKIMTNKTPRFKLKKLSQISFHFEKHVLNQDSRLHQLKKFNQN